MPTSINVLTGNEQIAVLGQNQRGGPSADSFITTSQAIADLGSGPGNVKTWGAKGDGITDDTLAIRMASAASADLFFPPGQYLYQGQYLVRPSNSSVTGAGSAVSVIIPFNLSNPDGTRTIFVNENRDTLGIATQVATTPSNQTDTNINISGLGFDLSLCNTPQTSTSLASFLLATNLSVSDIRADNFSDASAKGWSGFQFIGCDNYSVDGFIGRNAINAIDNWKGQSRARFSNICVESANAPGNGSLINWQGVGSYRADFETSTDLQIVNASLWLNEGAQAFFFDPDGAGSSCQNLKLDNISIHANTGLTNNYGIIFRGNGSRLKARGISFSAAPGADMRPVDMGGFFDGTAAVTGVNIIETIDTSSSFIVHYPGGADSGPGNYMSIDDGSGGPVVGNGLSLQGYYLITAVSGPVVGTSVGDTFTCTTGGATANASGLLNTTTKAQGWWGCVADCELSDLSFDGVYNQGLDLITLAGSGHRINGVSVTENYNGSTTPQYRAVIALDSTAAKNITPNSIPCYVENVLAAAGTGALPAGTAGDNVLYWTIQNSGKQPYYAYNGIRSDDHLLATVDATIGTLSANYLFLEGRATGFPPRVLAQGSDTNVDLGLHWQGAGSIQMQDSGGTLRHQFNTTNANLSMAGSAVPALQTVGVSNQVNNIVITGAPTGFNTSIAAQGTDANVRLTLLAQGTSGVLASGYTVAGTPSISDVPAGTWAVWKDTSGGSVKLYYNDGGTLKTVALT